MALSSRMLKKLRDAGFVPIHGPEIVADPKYRIYGGAYMFLRGEPLEGIKSCADGETIQVCVDALMVEGQVLVGPFRGPNTEAFAQRLELRKNDMPSFFISFAEYSQRIARNM